MSLMEAFGVELPQSPEQLGGIAADIQSMNPDIPVEGCAFEHIHSFAATLPSDLTMPQMFLNSLLEQRTGRNLPELTRIGVVMGEHALELARDYSETRPLHRARMQWWFNFLNQPGVRSAGQQMDAVQKEWIRQFKKLPPVIRP